MPQAKTAEVALVVPCFNEAARFSAVGFTALLRDPRICVLFVDDGSIDATRRVLEEFCEERERASFLALDENQGKAEAVRTGLREAIAQGVSAVGYLDADLSTPPEEAQRLVDALLSSGIEVVMGARVSMLGTQIDRRVTRHYLGRVFATLASVALDLAVYDTQCGAKAFRVTPSLRAALEAPFRSRWAFDVELIGRLVWGVGEVSPTEVGAIRELPLERWVDVAGSKLRPASMVRSGLELLVIGRDLRAQRGRWRRSS